MKTTLLLCLLVMGLSQQALSQQTISLSSFNWLVGTWQNIDAQSGETTTETWTWDASGKYVGMGVSVRGADTVFVEKLKIVEKDSICYYVADVSHNPAPVFFKITEVTATGFICENPEHDFPKKISYHYDGKILTATISAGKKEIPFRFRKTP